jgi:hypothetical protein
MRSHLPYFVLFSPLFTVFSRVFADLKGLPTAQVPKVQVYDSAGMIVCPGFYASRFTSNCLAGGGSSIFDSRFTLHDFRPKAGKLALFFQVNHE